MESRLRSSSGWAELQAHVEKWDRRFLELAYTVSQWSKDPSTKVGAVIADGNSVISLGYNGFPQKMTDKPELYENRDEKYSRIVHGEINALLFANKSVYRATLYTVPFMPCDRCAVQMIQAGIKRFVFPKASEETMKRWGATFEKTLRYFKECDIVFSEY